MSRQSIVGQIYGYGVSLLAVLIILFTIHGIVNNIFRVVNPAAGGEGMRVLMMHRFGDHDMGPEMGMPGPGMSMPEGNAVFWHVGHHNQMFNMQRPSGTASATPGDATQPAPGMGMGPVTVHANMLGNARFNAIRMLVIDIVMLIVGILLFRWHWDWLHKTA